MNRDISYVRHDYSGDHIDPAQAPDQPLDLFNLWLGKALELDPADANAMTLATVDAQGIPHARIVLLKGIEEHGLLFYTNYHSHKAEQLDACGNAAVVFWWPQMARQVRIEGRVEKVEPAISDRYFATRPRDSQLGAIASPQSTEIPSWEWLSERLETLTEQYGDSNTIERPAHWGGYRIIPRMMEFWQGQPNRLHDRLCYLPDETNEGQWQRLRLAP